MQDCLFCKIAAGDIPSNKLYEDETLLAFYDIDPQAPVHFLVIPKRHISSAAALTEEDAALLGHRQALQGAGGGSERVPGCHQCGAGRRPERTAPAFPRSGQTQPGLAAGLMPRLAEGYKERGEQDG